MLNIDAVHLSKRSENIARQEQRSQFSVSF